MANENEEKLPDDLKAFEAALGSLQPTARPIDRDRLMFLAGQASTSGAAQPPASNARRSSNRRGWGWPLATAMSLLFSISLMGRVAYLSNALDRLAAIQPKVDHELAMVDAAGPNLTQLAERRTTNATEENYIALRNAVVSGGADALPAVRCVGNRTSAKGSERTWPTLRSDFLGG